MLTIPTMLTMLTISKTCTCSPRGGACVEHSAYFAERERALGDAAEIGATVTEAERGSEAKYCSVRCRQTARARRKRARKTQREP